jgi:hypothetical protein
MNADGSPCAAESQSGAQAAHHTASLRRLEALDENRAAKNPGESDIPRGSVRSLAPRTGRIYELSRASAERAIFLSG